MSQYISKYVACPYYSRHDGNRICCEGLDPSNTINLVFENKKHQKEYGYTYCNDVKRCRKCKIYQMLDAKYGGADEIQK